MRLLRYTPDGGLGLTETFISDEEVPPYAILSHTWQDGHEVTFDDLLTGNGKEKAGYNKILFCARQAQRDGLDYCWADTCCIDKSSSAELSEALNSMFRWYQNAQRCYVYLSDVLRDMTDTSESFRRWKPAFRQSRWFTRGWTLQELIAPRSVEFFSKEEELLGSKATLELLLHEITGIPVKVLQGEALPNYSVTERFSWAAKRHTTRAEDESYCLLGIFGIYLPVIYGEGRLSAMKRLLNEVEGPPIEHLKAINNSTEHVRLHITTIQQNQDDARHSKIVEWISPTDYPTQQSDIIRRRQEGTGQWFLDAPEFTRWLGEARGTLFCPGIPGAGKTIVAAIAINYLLKSVQSSLVGVAYVYCNYKAQEEQDTSSILAAIVKQLVQGRLSIAEPVARLHKQHANRGTKPSLKEIFDALREVVAKYSTVYVAIDALDECRDSDGTRSQLLARLKDLQVGQDVRIIATARFIPEIEAEFQTAIRLEIQASDEDVRRYIAGQTHRLPRCIQRDPALQATMQDKIVEAVDGMFLLARLHTDSLLDKRTVKAVKSTLDRLSKGSAALNNAYNEAIQRIDSQLDGDKERAKRVLSWITYARRPLTTTELCCALAVEPDEAQLDPNNVPDVEDLLSVCAGLIIVDQESAVLRLVHYTTQEYLERIRDTWYPDAPLHIASVCLTYLSFDLFKTGGCPSDEEFEERLQENKFLDYAAKHWGEHVAKVESDACALACSFLSDICLVSSATQALLAPMYRYNDYSQRYPHKSTGAHLAARLGLSLALKGIVFPDRQERRSNLTKMDSKGQTLLYLAAENGHCLTVELLINKGAEVNAQGGPFGNALQAASARGHEATVKLLLNKGAEVNAQGGYYGNALQAASFNNHNAIVKLLLNKGAEVNAPGGYFGNALQAASARGHEATVKLLLDKGAKVNAQGGPFGNALQAASREGHEATVKLLLEKGAQVNTQGGHFGSALQAASARGHEAIVKLLLDKGAEVNAQGGYYGNALQAAAYEGHTEMLDLLIINGSTSQLQDYYGRTLLWWAAAGGKAATVEALIDKHNIDPQTADNLGRKPSRIAAKKGHDAVRKLLQAHDGESNTEPTVPSNGNYHQLSLECDVCTSNILTTDFHYHCDLCAGGDWDVCEDCKESGATCVELAHILIKRTMLDGVWSEAAS